MPVPNMRGPMLEKISYITPDGVEYLLTTGGGKSAVEIEGWGLPIPNIYSTRGPFQHGETLVGIRIPPRSVSLIHYHFDCSRDSYWENRAGLVNALRHNRSGLNAPEPGQLRRYLSDGSIYQLDVLCVRGPKFNSPLNDQRNFSYIEKLDFIAYDPFPYISPAEVETLTGWACTVVQELSFPSTFGTLASRIFGGSVCSTTQNLPITYTGTWETFPVIVLTGPLTRFRIEHNETGAVLDLSAVLLPGETATFDLTYGTKTVTKGDGSNLLGYISTDSDLATFSILPDPLVAGGVNTFTIMINDGAGGTTFEMSYFVRFEGI